MGIQAGKFACVPRGKAGAMSVFEEMAVGSLFAVLWLLITMALMAVGGA